MLNVNPINFNTQHKRNEPSFKAIHINEFVEDFIIDAFANSKNMPEIAKKYEIHVKPLSWNKLTESNFLDLNISRIKETVTSAIPQRKSIKKYFSNLIKPTKTTKVEEKENKIYTMNLTDKYSVLKDSKKLSFEEQIANLTPQKIEEFIKSKELEDLKFKEAQLKKKEALERIANMGK